MFNVKQSDQTDTCIVRRKRKKKKKKKDLKLYIYRLGGRHQLYLVEGVSR